MMIQNSWFFFKFFHFINKQFSIFYQAHLYFLHFEQTCLYEEKKDYFSFTRVGDELCTLYFFLVKQLKLLKARAIQKVNLDQPETVFGSRYDNIKPPEPQFCQDIRFLIKSIRKL
ncbi:unnamed protein product [Paramecium pentaurelia]|uniref:Uncharacterized protein n=1 Tax=Paramecium pentaurelia TaxID=43138 RepID=A0A8S1UMP7_9CILI|nr:unnamed protein product [Paramecium pentaurelia]